jgi:hypothetical protein
LSLSTLTATENGFIVRADEKLTAFLELEAAISVQPDCWGGLEESRLVLSPWA